ncbi:MAG: hypothetical protein WCC87_05180 [Candidatus Korobacteraceae bacterium]
MPTEFPGNDPQNVWQNQPTEAFKMSADQLRLKAQKRQKGARSQVLRDAIIGLTLSVFFAWDLIKVNHVWWGLDHPLSLWSTRVGLGMLSLWGLALPVLLYKWVWPVRLSPDAPLKTTLQWYRSQLEKGVDFDRRVGLVLMPAFVGMALFIVPALISSLGNPRELLQNSLPLFGLFAIWLPIFLYLRKRRRGRRQKEIEQLRAFESENRV